MDDESDYETSPKKTRVDGDDFIDGDEEAAWHGSNEDMDVDDAQPVKRGSKRVASPEEEDRSTPSRPTRRDKRARRVSGNTSLVTTDEDMDEDEVDEDGPVGIARGKKRDRAEAGSSFGGDDSVMGDDEKPRRRRRRRTVSNKLGHGSSRGQKRGRGLDSQDSDNSEAEEPTRQTGRKKRGKRSQDDLSPISNDPLCKGKRIGEQWTSNGIFFKVGPNGQRLRQALVKKARSKFPMVSPQKCFHGLSLIPNPFGRVILSIPTVGLMWRFMSRHG